MRIIRFHKGIFASSVEMLNPFSGKAHIWTKTKGMKGRHHAWYRPTKAQRKAK